MKEVSCRVFGFLFREAQRRHVSPEALLAGTGHTPDHFRDKDERVDWAVFLRVMSNAGRLWPSEQLVDIGRGFLRSTWVRPLVLIGRLLYSVRDFYWWTHSDKIGPGNQMFSCIRPTCTDLGPGHLEIRLTLSPGYTECPEFYFVSMGGMIQMSDALGYGPADVKMRTDANGAVYDVRFPNRGGPLAWLRKAVTWPFVAPATARELKEAHETLQRRYEELEDYRNNLERKVSERTAELCAARDQLAAAFEARQRFFANVNHELRTPLQLINLGVATLRQRQEHLGAASVAALAGIDTSVDRLLRLVNDVLLLAAGQEGKLTLRFEERDLAALVARLIAEWTPAAAKAGISLACHGPEMLVVEIDPAAIDRVLTNLISNAIKFTPEGGSVDVSLIVDGEDDTVEIAVRDTGVGVDEAMRERIFERFEQGRPPVREGQRGSGIGLSLVRELVNAHGGKVWVEPGGSKGSVFRVLLPRHAQAGEAPRREHPSTTDGWNEDSADLRAVLDDAPTVPVLTQPAGPARATILVVEDDINLLRSLIGLLSGDYRVVAASDGLQACRYAKEHLPDLLISDISLPGMDGYEVTRRFRELPGNRLAPVLLMSAHGDVVDRVHGFEEGAADYIVKPFHTNELLARVRAQLALRDMALRLSENEKLSALGTLTAALAHELRNPANGIINAIAPLREALPTDSLIPGQPASELLGVVELCAGQIAAVSRQLLGFSRSGDMLCSAEPVPKLMERLMLLAEHRRSRCQLRRGHTYEGTVVCSGPFIVQLLLNLVENGVHAAGEGGWVQIDCTRDGDNLLIDVADSGPGVPPQLRERIFEPFFTTKPPGQGTGLGLSTSRRIAEQHGGALTVLDGTEGTLFRLRLPLDGPRAQRARSSEARSEAASMLR